MLPSRAALLRQLSLVTLFYLTSGQTTPEDLFSIRKFDNVQNTLGLPATLVCYADSTVLGVSNSITYTIVKDGQTDYLTNEISTGRVSMRKENGRLFISFTRLIKSDEGSYTCSASISGSEQIFSDTQKAILTVDETTLVFLNEAVSVFTAVPRQDVQVSVCNTNQETVAAESFGPVTVRWELNGETLNIAASSSYSYANGVLTIRDYSVFEAAYSNFTCNVEWLSQFTNKTDIASRSFSVSIDGAPNLLGRPGYVYFYNLTIDGTTQYTVECNMVLPYNQLVQYTTYDWYYPATSQQAVSRSVSSNSPYVDGQNRLVLTDAHPRHSGLYRCTGSNVFGSNSSYSNVTVIYPAPIIWVQFYMIIIYVVVVLAIIILFIALCIRFCCLGFCYVKEKKVVVDSTFYTTSKFDEVEEKKPLPDKTEFQEVEVDMQLAGVEIDESDDEHAEVPKDEGYKPQRKLTGYEGIEIEAPYPWDNEAEAARLHRTDPEQLVVAAKPKQRPRRKKPKQTYVEFHPTQPEEPKIEPIPEPKPDPEPVIETPESQRKVDITKQPVVEMSPYDVGPTVVMRKKETTEVFKVIEDTEPLIEEDRMSGESQVFEATFGMSDLESEEPPDSDFNM